MQRQRRAFGLPKLLGGILTGVLLAGCSLLGDSTTTTSPPPPTSVYNKFIGAEQAAYQRALSDLRALRLPSKAGAPAPSLPPGAFARGISPHTVLGFLPSWEVSQAGSLDYGALSEICYFALQVEPGGKILQSGQGWSVLGGGEVDGLVSRAHATGDRVLLSLFTDTEATLHQMASSPEQAGKTLASQVAPLLAAHHFDGVDLDFEGRAGTDRAGFTRFVAAFSTALRADGPRYQIVLNTFPQAAVDPSSLFDLKALSPYVDEFFVMAYDMGDQSSPGPTAPLIGQNLTDAASLASYEAVVAPSKIILGIPFYGYDFQASRERPPAIAVGQPLAVTYASITATGRPALWDPTSQTPYIAFKRAGQWHQTWFDDPVSVALKVALASAFHTAGVGVWELGMAQGKPAMMRALDGGSTPARQPLSG